MNYFKQYSEYLKDNPEKYWFKRKIYGWGWTPATWQGWMVLLAWVLVFVYIMTNMAASNEEPWKVFVAVCLSVTILIYICYKKGETPRWQWGPKD